MSKRKIILFVIVGLIIIVGVSWYSRAQTSPPSLRNTPLTVSTVLVKTQAMPLLWQTTGTIEAQQTVNVTPQVTATIASIDIQEGRDVQKGEVLLHLDPRSFENALVTSQAALAQDQAKLISLKKDLARYKTLAQQGVIAEQQYDQALSNKLAQDDQIKADQAQVKQSQLQLSYTTVTAPMEGKTGAIVVHVGDLVTANVTSLLTINQLNTINVAFSIPQNNFSKLMEYQAQKTIQIEIASDAKTVLSNGLLSFIDNNVDPASGSVLLKASFDNSKHSFWPGQTVAVKIILAIQDKALVLSTRVIQIDQNGYFVYLIQDNKAVLQRITVDRIVGELSIISEGLTNNQPVISEIPPNLKNGSLLRII
jgi:multidrug efflux system membrane fusion protein